MTQGHRKRKIQPRQPDQARQKPVASGPAGRLAHCRSYQHEARLCVDTAGKDRP